MRGRHGLRAIRGFLGFEHPVFVASPTGHLKHGPDRRRSHRPAGLIIPAFRRYETRWKFSYRNSTPRSAASAGSAYVVAVGVADGGGPVPRSGFGEDPVYVGLDRVVAKVQATDQGGTTASAPGPNQG